MATVHGDPDLGGEERTAFREVSSGWVWKGARV